MMEEDEAHHARRLRDVHRVLQGAVSPTDLAPVLLLGVLRVVDHEVGAAHERDVTLVARVLRNPAWQAPERLVVGHVGERRPAARQPVPDRRPGVVQVLRLYAHLSDAEEALVELRVVDTAPQLAELDGEVRVLHLPGHRLLEAPLEAARRVDVQLGPGQERGDEEREALDVVPMGVADEEVESHRLGHRPNEVEPEPADAGAAVEDDDGPVGGAYLGARRVAAVDGGRGSRRGDGSSRAPESDLHGKFYDYHTATCLDRRNPGLRHLAKPRLR